MNKGFETKKKGLKLWKKYDLNFENIKSAAEKNRLRATTDTALSPLFLSLKVGMSKSIRFVDLSALAGMWGCKSSDKYGSTMPLRLLKTGTKILKKTGSQCREARTGVIWSCCFFSVWRVGCCILYNLQATKWWLIKSKLPPIIHQAIKCHSQPNNQSLVDQTRVFNAKINFWEN